MKEPFLQPVLFLAGSAIASFVLCFPVRRALATAGVIDQPNARSSHTLPTVRGGGIAILVPVLLFTLFPTGEQRVPLLILLGSAGILALVSWFDDLKSISPLRRFGAHGAVALFWLWALNWPRVEFVIGSTWSWRLSALLGTAVLFLWLAGYTNSFNFMDGINGIASGQAFVTALGTALVVGTVTHNWKDPMLLLSLTIAGAAAGFLPHNFPRARMFMGDVGSAPVGFLLAALVVGMSSRHGMFLLVPLCLLHANFVLDTAVTLVRRVLRGERWHAPHREHFYQRLIRSGKSHAFVTGFEMGLQVLVLGSMLVYVHTNPGARPALASLVLVIWLAFFFYAERVFRRSFAQNKAPGFAGPLRTDGG